MCKWRTVRDRSCSRHETIPLDARRVSDRSHCSATVTFPRSTHTAIIGPAGCGAIDAAPDHRRRSETAIRRSAHRIARRHQPQARAASAALHDLRDRRAVTLVGAPSARRRGAAADDRSRGPPARDRDGVDEVEPLARPASRFVVVDGANAREPGADRDSQAGHSGRGQDPRRRQSVRRTSPTSFTGRFA